MLKTPYKFEKSYGGTLEPQIAQGAPWLHGSSLKKSVEVTPPAIELDAVFMRQRAYIGQDSKTNQITGPHSAASIGGEIG
jgi:hypothetical protein